MNTIVVGLQYGDEGKGKIVDHLAANHDWVVRYQGGGNAGHTLYTPEGDKLVLHQIPSGILQHKKCYIGNGCVVDLDDLKQEIDLMADYGYPVTGQNLKISPKAHVVTLLHKMADFDKNGHIGTTNKGIGPAYVDKADRKGQRIAEFLNADDGSYGWLKAHVSDPLLELISSGSVLFEGAQGTMLDLDHGTYPFVTSSNCTAGGACTGTGFPPNKIDEVVGVAKAYVTRVGNGFLPTEITGPLQEQLRNLGGEFGATTGRPRRCGWLDLVQLHYACTVNGVDHLYITKLDVLYKLPSSHIYQGFSNGHGNHSTDMYFGDKAYQIYGTQPNLVTDFHHKNYATLHEYAVSYCQYISKRLTIPVTASLGPKRNDLITITT